MNILVSACLLNVNCRYNGTGILHSSVLKLMASHQLIPVCPELFGGLCTPRPPAEIIEGRVVNIAGNDVTEAYEKGAEETLKLAKLFNCKLAVLKERSPSCGHGTIYDGSFTATLTEGNGITADLLIKNGIEVIGESEVLDYFISHR
ncbi:MAG: DUF523 domain-containing protein [Clostridiales bacterium]|nr:DUF523 domain-containing protein [Clostridiales bacterium]